MNKTEIIPGLNKATKELLSYCSTLTDDVFFRQPSEKWSIAQNIRHLVISANATRLAFTLPKFVVKLYAGKPNRASRSYDELVNKYKLKLEQGAKASPRFTPGPVLKDEGRQQLMDSFTNSMDKLGRAIERKWTDEQLDQFIAPHPLLGKITLRELCFFTIYHTYHHLAIIRQRAVEVPAV